MENALEKAIRTAGGQSALARLIGPPVSQGHVWKWLQSGRVPAEQVIPIVKAVDGEVTPHDLRPDIYPDADWMPSSGSALGKGATEAEV